MRLHKEQNIKISYELGEIALKNYLSLTKKSVEKKNKPLQMEIKKEDENHL